MEKKKTKKKWREIRSAVTMMCVMAAMMSTATFAWFTLTENATVAGLQMTAASTGGLLVSKSSNADFSNAIQIEASTDHGTNLNSTANTNNVLVLKPVTPATNAGEFSLPKYDGGYVTGLQADAISGDDLKDYVATYTYWLKAESGTVDVGIVTGNANQSPSPTLSNGIAQATGTFIREKNNTTASATTLNAAAAIRIGLVVEGVADPVMYIYEPNADVTATSSKLAEVAANANITEPTAHIVSGIEGKITGGSYGTATGTSTSDKLFSVDATTAKKVTMYVWLEGTDDQCGNEIQADELEGQIQFTIIE